MNVTLTYLLKNHDTGINVNQTKAGVIPRNANSQQIKKEERNTPQPIDININAEDLRSELLPILLNVSAAYIRSKYQITDKQKQDSDPSEYTEELIEAKDIVKKFLNLKEK